MRKIKKKLKNVFSFNLVIKSIHSDIHFIYKPVYRGSFPLLVFNKLLIGEFEKVSLASRNVLFRTICPKLLPNAGLLKHCTFEIIDPLSMVFPLAKKYESLF
jgi:hypothetical protein